MDERMRTNNNIHILKDIEIGYWCEENRYFTKKAVHESTKVQLALMKRRGFLKDYNPQSNYEIVTDIEDSILRYRSGNLEILLEIFDLIQCWGGRMGKSPYVKKDSTTGKIPRYYPDYWTLYYETAVQERISIDEALDHLCKIPMVGVSFATKHLMFWHRAPIFDTRMQLLMFGERAPRRFNEFRDGIRELAAHWKVEDFLVERGLFAFSENYFPNEYLELKDETADQTDSLLAQLVAEQSLKRPS